MKKEMIYTHQLSKYIIQYPYFLNWRNKENELYAMMIKNRKTGKIKECILGLDNRLTITSITLMKLFIINDCMYSYYYLTDKDNKDRYAIIVSYDNFDKYKAALLDNKLDTVLNDFVQINNNIYIISFKNSNVYIALVNRDSLIAKTYTIMICPNSKNEIISIEKINQKFRIIDISNKAIMYKLIIRDNNKKYEMLITMFHDKDNDLNIESFKDSIIEIS